jgi:tetratricopeptide (TPR) repeat protein
LKVERKALAGGCAVLAALAAATTRARAEVWSDPVSIWEDTVRKSPEKSRAHFQLGYAYSEQQRFDRAIAEFERAAALQKADYDQKAHYDLLVDWGLAYDGLHQPEKALAKFREAAALEPTAHAYTQIAKVYGEQSQWKNALDALEMAEKLDRNFAYTYAYRGLVFLAMGNVAGSVPEFQHALAIDPTLQPARDGLRQALQQPRAR